MKKRWDFVLDVAATSANKKCRDYLADALDKDTNWSVFGAAFCNPPYSDIMPWLKKAVHEIDSYNCRSVTFVLPMDLSTEWGRFCSENASKIIFIVGRRIQFVAPEGIKSSSNNRGTMLVEFSLLGKELHTEYVDINEIKGYTDD